MGISVGERRRKPKANRSSTVKIPFDPPSLHHYARQDKEQILLKAMNSEPVCNLGLQPAACIRPAVVGLGGSRPFNLHLYFWKPRSWEIKVWFKLKKKIRSCTHGFFSVCHLDFFYIGDNLAFFLHRWSPRKEIQVCRPEIFLRFETDLSWNTNIQFCWYRIIFSWL